MFLERVLDRSVTSDWISTLRVHWQPHMLSAFSSSAQRRLRKLGLLEEHAPFSPADLVGNAVTSVNDLTVLLCLATQSEQTTPHSDPFVIKLASTPVHQRKRAQAKPIELHAPQKWRPDPFTPFALVFDGGVRINHTDSRYSWWIHLLLRHGPAHSHGNEIPAETFLQSCRDHDERLIPLASNLLRSVNAARSMTVQEEIEDFAAIISRANRNRSATASMITMRFGCDGTFRSLDDCASAFGVTRQAIFNSIATARSLCSSTDYCPALRSLVRSVDELSGRSLAAAQDELRPLLGSSQSLQGALHFAKEFLGLSPRTTVYSATPSGSRSRARFLGKDSAKRSLALFAPIRSAIVTSGLAYTADAISALSPGSADSVGLHELQDAIAHDPSIVFLGHERRWLVWTDPQSPLLQALLQVCHVAHPFPLPVSEAAQALRAHLDAVSATVHPPISLLREAVLLLHSKAGLAIENDDLVLPSTARPLELVPQAQRPIYQHLVDSGGYADFEDLTLTIPTLGGLSQSAQRDRLASCTFLHASGPGYRLIGWPDPLRKPRLSQASPSYRVDESLVQVVVTNSAAQRVKASARLIYLPSPLDTLIEGEFEHHDRRWPSITISNGRVRRLSPVASALGVMDGEPFKLHVDLDRLNYRVELLPR